MTNSGIRDPVEIEWVHVRWQTAEHGIAWVAPMQTGIIGTEALAVPMQTEVIGTGMIAAPMQTAVIGAEILDLPMQTAETALTAVLARQETAFIGAASGQIGKSLHQTG